MTEKGLISRKTKQPTNYITRCIRGICSKMSVLVWLEFELAYYEIPVQHVNHYTVGTHHMYRQYSKYTRVIQ